MENQSQEVTSSNVNSGLVHPPAVEIDTPVTMDQWKTDKTYEQ